MPTYEYRCTECETPFEAVHGMSQTPRVTCPQCGALARRRIASAAAVMPAAAQSLDGREAHRQAGEACGGCPNAGGGFPCAWNQSPAELGF